MLVNKNHSGLVTMFNKAGNHKWYVGKVAIIAAKYFFMCPVENAHQWILWAQNIKERIILYYILLQDLPTNPCTCKMKKGLTVFTFSFNTY